MATGSPLVQTLRDLQLLNPDQLAEIEKHPLAQNPDPKPLARELLQRSWLNAYQVNQLLQGRGAELAVGPYRILDRLGKKWGLAPAAAIRTKTLSRPQAGACPHFCRARGAWGKSSRRTIRP